MEKKKKKTKYQPLDISMTVVQSSWANDDSVTLGGISEMNAIREKLPSAPKAERTAYDITQLPAQGPWKAHVGNLPFNVKEDELMKFLGGESEIEDLNIPTQGGRMRGFAVVTFVSREALASAMEKSDDTLMNRRISISLLNDENRENRGGGRYGDNSWGNRRDENRRPPRDDDDGDWRSAPAPPREDTMSRPERPERSGPSNGDWNRGPPRRNWQDDDSRSSSRPTRFGERSDRYDDREREAPVRRERDWERGPERSEGAWGRDRARDRDTGDRERDTGDRDRARDRDTGDRDRERSERDRDYGRDRDRRPPPGYERPAEGGGAPRERPKLVLQPRSKPTVDVAAASNGETARPASIFGAAKPVDTASREREIEIRIAERRDVAEPARRRGMDRDEMPPPTPPAGPSEKGPYGRARKSSDSSTGKNRNPSVGSGSGSSLPLRQSNSDVSPASPPPRGSFRDGGSDRGRHRMPQVSSGPGDEDEVFSQSDSRQRRSSNTSSNAQHDSHHHQAPPSQPQSTLVDAPPPSVNVWQVRRNQMQRRVAEVVADSHPVPPSSAASAATPVSNSAPPAAAPVTPVASAVSHPPAAASASASAEREEKRPMSEVVAGKLDASTERTVPPSPAEVKEDKEEKAVPAHPAHSQQRRSPVVVSVKAAQRAAAEGHPPPPPIRENAWQQAHSAMDAVRRPPSPRQQQQQNAPPPQPYASDRGYSSYQQPHDWSEGGSRGAPRGDYRDGGGYRGGYQRGGRGNNSWRGSGGGRGNRGGSGYRGRGRGGGGGYRGYQNTGGETANAPDM